MTHSDPSEPEDPTPVSATTMEALGFVVRVSFPDLLTIIPNSAASEPQ